MKPDMKAELSRDARPRLTPLARLQWDPARERYVLLMPESVLVLNATGAAILTRCDGSRTVAAIGEELRAKYGDLVEPEIAVFLQRAAHRRLVMFDADEGADD
jgi:pyrroloquinoline quinone biosynthesis protein D